MTAEDHSESCDVRQLRHQTACAECPWRKRALKGWLGGYDVESYSTPVKYNVPTSCHCRDFGASSPETALCVGSLHTISNQCGVPREQSHAQAAKLVGINDEFFNSARDFEEYHTLEIISVID